MKIDAHQHFWSLRRGDYGWLTPDLEALYRDFEPKDLEPELAAAGVDRTVLVQAAPTLAETRFLLELAERTAFVSGVVGWVDLESADAGDQLGELAAHPAFVGVRPMLQDLPDPEWVLRPGVAPALERIAALDLAFDALVRPHQLPVLATLLERHPGLRVVIDHGAKPDIARGGLEPWSRDLARLADAGALCKLSGLLGEAPQPTLPCIAPYAERLLELFAPGRLLWGSDWPVLTLAAGYGEWWQMTGCLLEPLDEAARRAILGGNAARCYRLAEEV